MVDLLSILIRNRSHRSDSDISQLDICTDTDTDTAPYPPRHGRATSFSCHRVLPSTALLKRRRLQATLPHIITTFQKHRLRYLYIYMSQAKLSMEFAVRTVASCIPAQSRQNCEGTRKFLSEELKLELPIHRSTRARIGLLNH